jgi:nitroreductase
MQHVEETLDTVDALQWRYATKQFDPTKKIPAHTWDRLEQALLLTPSSFGLQPWKFVVVTDQSLKEKLVPSSWNQKQPAECSHLVVLCRLNEMNEKHIDEHLNAITKIREVPPDSVAGLRKVLVDFISTRSEAELADWMSKQCYIALGNLMTAAAQMRVDNCPMEGFVKEDYDKILGLPELGCRSVVVCALGYRHPDDKYGKLKKVRFDPSKIVIKK